MNGGVAVASTVRHFLRVPPFPGSNVVEFGRVRGREAQGDTNPNSLCDLIRAARIGGAFWGSQPVLPDEYWLCRDPSRLASSQAKAGSIPVFGWTDQEARNDDGDLMVRGCSDPWHMLQRAAVLVCRPDDPVLPIAALLKVPVDCDGAPRVHPPVGYMAALSKVSLQDPFTGAPMSVAEAIALCAGWRQLIDANRGIAGGYGFAFWKKEAVAALLWDGSWPFRFMTRAEEAHSGAPVAIWHTRTPQDVRDALAAAAVPLIEVEDGFLRSRGLGADCVPPMSLVVDRLGPYFDPTRPSELEGLLQEGPFDPDLVARAATLRAAIVDAGLGKYEAGRAALDRFVADRRHILVPGQVEDDRSILTGGAGLTSNLELLKRVRNAAPDAFIIYKPHPDVLAGHRVGATGRSDALQFADTIVTDTPISSLLDMVDEVHVNTSLTGFEALLRGKAVTTHGVPFYAGWGLTTDLGPIPARRTARRSLDELVAAALILYPRYLDPVTGLPCPAEIAVSRLSGELPLQGGMVVALRRMQGKVMKRVRKAAS